MVQTQKGVWGFLNCKGNETQDEGRSDLENYAAVIMLQDKSTGCSSHPPPTPLEYKNLYEFLKLCRRISESQ